MLTKTSSPERGMIDSKAKAILSTNELSTLDYYITQYEQGHIAIEDFTAALLQLLNTNNKVSCLAMVFDRWSCGIGTTGSVAF